MSRPISKKSSLLCREMVGRRVVLTDDVTTRGGREFHQGEVLVVASVHRGRFELRYPGGSSIGVRQVPRGKFEVLP